MPLRGAKPGWYYLAFALVVFTVVSLKLLVAYEYRPDVVLVASAFLLAVLVPTCLVAIVVLNPRHAPGWRNYLHLAPLLACLGAGQFAWEANWNPGGQPRRPAPYRDWDKPLIDRADIEAYRYAHRLEVPDPYVPDDFFNEGWLGPFGRTTRLEYIDYLCKHVAGEFIYRTVEDVEGVVQLRPRLEETQEVLSDRYAMEDPYGYLGRDYRKPNSSFLAPGGYRVFESRYPIVAKYSRRDDEKALKEVMRNHGLLNPPSLRYTGFRQFERQIPDQKPPHLRTIDGYWITQLENPQARYGYTWRGIRVPYAREYGIAGAELIVVDREDDSVLAVRRGFVAASLTKHVPSGLNWEFGFRCPDPAGGERHASGDFYFVSKVLRPTGSREANGAHTDTTR